MHPPTLAVRVCGDVIFDTHTCKILDECEGVVQRVACVVVLALQHEHLRVRPATPTRDSPEAMSRQSVAHNFSAA
eukprot:1173912-Pyramimonas_sp.AAC.1